MTRHYMMHPYIGCIKLLLSMPGVDVNIRNGGNETAHDLAKNRSVKRLFKEHQEN